MAMEIKTLDIDNEEEERTINFWQQFGWQFKSSQRVYNQDTSLEECGDTLYSVTRTMDFTKLVFERDKNMPHYAEIVALEQEFLTLKRHLPKDRPHEPITYENVQAYANSANPDLFYAWRKRWVTIFLVGFAITTVIWGFLAVLVGLLPDVLGVIILFLWLGSFFLFMLGLIGMGLSVIMSKSINKRLIAYALRTPTSNSARELEKAYANWLEFAAKTRTAIANYDHAMIRMPQIIAELDILL